MIFTCPPRRTTPTGRGSAAAVPDQGRVGQPAGAGSMAIVKREPLGTAVQLDRL